MSKIDDEILEEISDFLVVYLKQGQVDFNTFIKKTELPLSQLDQLLKIHFLLKCDVIHFVENLPQLIRRLKTSTTIQNTVYHGQIKGKINWQRTIHEPERMRTKNKMIVSVNERNREYAIKENLVLLEAIETIHSILHDDVDFQHFKKYDWFKKWESLDGTLNMILHKNVYLSRVRKNRTDVTYRMIVDTLKHRNPLYRQAAFILMEYKRILAGELNHEEIVQLLKETFVYPQEKDVLFELYWVMNIIKQNASSAALQLIDGKNNIVAKWEDSALRYEVYHDSTGSSNLQFKIPIDEVDKYYNPFVKRKLQSIQSADKAINDFFDQSICTKTYWSGRPDFLVEIYDKETNHLKEVVIGEVKYTVNLAYAKTGLRELTDYITFVKDSNDYYLADQIMVRGLLCTERIEGYKKQGNDVTLKYNEKDIEWKSL